MVLSFNPGDRLQITPLPEVLRLIHKEQVALEEQLFSNVLANYCLAITSLLSKGSLLIDRMKHMKTSCFRHNYAHLRDAAGIYSLG